MMAAVVLLGGCAKEDKRSRRRRNRDDDNTTSVTSTTMTSGGTVNGYEYTLTKPEEYGPDLGYGWYIRDTADEKYVLICRGFRSCGGYFIEVTNIEYDDDTDTVIIRVMNTTDPAIQTDAYTHPCCSVKFNELPANIRVINESDTEMEFGGRIINTEEWAVDVKRDDDYVAIFMGGYQGNYCCTYLYETGPNEFRYINVLFRDENRQEAYVKGSGTIYYLGGIEYVAQQFGSWSQVLEKGNEDNPIPVEDYMKDKVG